MCHRWGSNCFIKYSFKKEEMTPKTNLIIAIVNLIFQLLNLIFLSKTHPMISVIMLLVSFVVIAFFMDNVFPIAAFVGSIMIFVVAIFGVIFDVSTEGISVVVSSIAAAIAIVMYIFAITDWYFDMKKEVKKNGK